MGHLMVSESGEVEAMLRRIKERTWFYEFELPDGTRTTTDVPADVLPIHASRRDKLVRIISERVAGASELSAIDMASHEGFYSVEMSRHFRTVRGLEVRQSSLEAARLITSALGISNVVYEQADLQTMRYAPEDAADFVLLYGLIYHLENPVHTLRLASQLCRRHLLIETQVFPYDVSGGLEDGHYMNVRRIEGVFGLTPDYSAHREGGSTDIALVPSLNALLFLLRTFGFRSVEVLPSHEGDYEQFRRGSRVLVYAEK